MSLSSLAPFRRLGSVAKVAICWIAGLLAAGCDRGGATRDDVKPEAATINETTRDSVNPVTSESSSLEANIVLTDVTKECGVEAIYRNGGEANNFSILESLGGGAGLIDFDNDGWLDLFFSGGGGYRQQEIYGLPTKVYRNLGDWRFVDISQTAGGGFPAEHYSHGVFAADYDADGFDDFLITGFGGLQLWRNLGDGTFEEVHREAQLADDLWSSAAGFGDFNGDGLIDLYVVHYVNWSFANHPFCAGPQADIRDICPPKVFEPLPDRLFINLGNGAFRDASEEAELRKDGKGLGVVIADIDADGDVDIYVANDTTENFLYINDGSGVFEEIGAIAGVAVDDRGTPNGSMGVDVGDFNRDGEADLWVANFEVESFAMYRNEGNHQFLHVSQATGVTALNGLFVGFGTVFADLNRDGYEDLVVANGHVIKYPRMAPLLQKPLVLLSDGGRHFRRLPMKESPYFTSDHAGRGLAAGDLDNDGDLDFVFANNVEPAAILRNDTKTDRDWLRVRLIGRRSNRNAIGARVGLSVGGETEWRYIKGGSSYLSQSDLRPTWGFSKSMQATSLVLEWPNSNQTQTHKLEEGKALTIIEVGNASGGEASD